MDLFLQACGGGPLQLRLERPGGVGVEGLSLDTPYVVVGRDPRSDLVLDHRDVCARHAYLQAIGGRLYCVDLGSRGGISFGGQNRRSGWVEPRRALRIGPYRIRAGAPDGDEPSAPGGPDLPGLTLDLVHRGFKATECRVDGPVALVGSSDDCQVRLLDPGVSGVHCSLLTTPTGVWVVDLLARGGVRVNGVPVRHALLHEEDTLQVGRSTIRPRHEAGPVPGRSHTEAVPVPAPRPGPEPEPESVPETGRSVHRPAPRVPRPYRNDDDAIEMHSAKERRGSCRYLVSGVDALLSWWEPTAVSSVIPSTAVSSPRRSTKEEAISARAMVRWRSGSGGTAAAARDPMRPLEEIMKSTVVGVRVLDISQTGVLVLGAGVPPAGSPLWLRLESPQATEWVEVVLLGVTPEAPGAFRVRLAFRDTCPYDLFKIAVYSKPGP